MDVPCPKSSIWRKRSLGTGDSNISGGGDVAGQLSVGSCSRESVLCDSCVGSSAIASLLPILSNLDFGRALGESGVSFAGPRESGDCCNSFENSD
jgi:hypothetical protein